MADIVSAKVDPGAVLREVGNIEKEIALIVKKMKGMKPELEDDEDYQIVCEQLLRIVERRKYIDEQRDGFMQEARALIKRVEGWFAKAYGDIEESESFFREAARGYLKKLSTTINELREEGAALPAKQRAKALALFQRADELEAEIPKVPGISVTTKPSLIIEDEKAIPKKYFRLVLDEKLVLAELGAGRQVPGAKLAVEKSIRVTPSHAKKGGID
jgi:hypothetical protein